MIKKLFTALLIAGFAASSLSASEPAINKEITERQYIADKALYLSGGILAADLLFYLSHCGYKKFLKNEIIDFAADFKTGKKISKALLTMANPFSDDLATLKASNIVEKHKLLATLIALTAIGETAALGTWGYQKIKIRNFRKQLSQPAPQTIPSESFVAQTTGDNPTITEEGEITFVIGKDGKKYQAGTFRTATIEDLEQGAPSVGGGTFQVITGNDPRQFDVAELQANPENAGATFLVASQFNCLESYSSAKVPHPKIYYADRTQGPLASVSALPGTMMRYQEHRNVNTLDAFDGKEGRPLIPVRNGYINFATEEQVEAFTVEAFNAQANQVKIGIQEETQVVASNIGRSKTAIAPEGQIINQVFASTIDLSGFGYNGFHGQAQKERVNQDKMNQLAGALLTQQYRGAILAASEAAQKQSDNETRPGRKKLFLTMLGGGAFGNSHKIIARAIDANAELIRNSGLDVQLRLFPGSKLKGPAESILHRLASRFK
jgi:hypothetical protein